MKSLLLCLLVSAVLTGCNSNLVLEEEDPEVPEVPEEPEVPEKNFIEVFEEVAGVLSVEAEDFSDREAETVRKWYLMDGVTPVPEVVDSDENSNKDASNAAYLEILPDTRVTHSDKLIVGQNFMNDAGKMALLHYDVYFNNPGRYFVWVRTRTRGTEDNGIHVGLNGSWPSSGHRMQFDGGKNKWSWESRQRTNEVHTGIERLIFLDIETVGRHTVSFSMREDGFEFDKWVMEKEYKRPAALGPDPKRKKIESP